ncbi:MAG: Hpt domain-containing protein [Nitratireductor sp.]|jgi:HPt (histidine-containing phosphotransfer) domain-containing protein|nr:Hpt domain-containing protein [Nitratireductor sp.]
MSMALKADIAKARSEHSGKPVDLVHLSGQTMGDPALEAEVLRIFLSQAPTWVDACKRAQVHSARRDAAHALKGSARAIGAFALADRAAAAELPGFTDFDALDAELGRVFAYIRTLI